MRRLSLPFVLLLACGCAGARYQIRTTCASPTERQALVFVADGAGNFQGLSGSLRDTARACGAPVCVATVEWSHGYGRALADQTDPCHAVERGRRLAADVLAYRRQPGALPVYLVAHSAGSAVVLAAAEALPPDCVERIVLLAPSVSALHDLRPALRSARRGVDVFYSPRDVGYLGTVVGVVGTSDGLPGPAAGRVGFRVAAAAPEDAALVGRLRQHPWDPAVGWTGHRGGHFDCFQPAYLRTYVLPLLLPGAEAPAVP
jgi:pimeloyl-ACP methyl ester carboxylesterase